MAHPTDLLAVLIDADNVPSSKVGAVISEIARFGTASVKRVYGDWTTTRLAGWKTAASEHVIQPMQQFANTVRKNATDSALIIDAMDLLYTRRFSGFCIVSSDSDFTRLATRIREDGVTVYGFGERKTPEAFRNACDTFTYLEVLGEGEVEEIVAAPHVPCGRISGATRSLWPGCGLAFRPRLARTAGRISGRSVSSCASNNPISTPGTGATQNCPT